jgi:hypothetical protein
VIREKDMNILIDIHNFFQAYPGADIALVVAPTALLLAYFAGKGELLKKW